MGSVVLDANVAIAFLDPTDASHGLAVDHLGSAIARGDELLIPASAYAETLVRPMRDGRDDEYERFVDCAGVTVMPLDRDLARSAARLRAKRRSLALGDALVLATALERGAELLTFDQRLQRAAREEL